MAKPLASYERNIVYNELVNKLDNLKLLNLPIEGIKKLLVMAKLFRDHAMEFNGEIKLPLGMIITYEFYKDHRKQTNVNISKRAHILYNYYKNNMNVDVNKKADANEKVDTNDEFATECLVELDESKLDESKLDEEL